MLYAVTYRRVSTEEQAQSDLSLVAQDKAMGRWLAERPDHRLIANFSDEGVSAYAPADLRPGFQEMIRFCLKNKVDLLLVHKLDRFSRHRRECAIFKDMLARHGVKVRSVSEEFDPDTAQGVLLEGILETLAQFFSMNLGTETLKGMRENAERGWFNGGAVPYGYRVTRVKQGGREYGRLEPAGDEQTAIVREIFQLAVEQGKGCRTIAVLLNERKVPSATGIAWSPNSVHTILSNPVYAGDSVWFKSKKRGRNGRQSTAPEDRIAVENTHTALVPREVFQRYQALAATRPVQAQNKRRAPAPADPAAPPLHPDQAQPRQDQPRPVKNLLAGFIRCRHCGHTFYGVDRATRRQGQRVPRPVYVCHGYLQKGASVCTSLALPKDWLEAAVLDQLRRRLCTPDGQTHIANAVAAHIEQRRRAFTTDASALSRQVADCDRRIQNYYRAIGDGMDPSVCRQHIAELTAKKDKLEAEQELLAQEDIYGRALARNQDLLRDFSGTFEHVFDKLSLHRKRQILARFLVGIDVIEHKTVRLNLRVPFDTHGLKTLLTPEQEGDGGGGDGLTGGGVAQGGGRRHSDHRLGAIPIRLEKPRGPPQGRTPRSFYTSAPSPPASPPRPRLPARAGRRGRRA